MKALEEFEEYNIDVIHDTFVTNEEMYVKIKAEAIMILLSFRLHDRTHDQEDMLERLILTHSNYKYIDDRFKDLALTEQWYSVPYMWGTVGIIYNKTMVDEPVDSWQVLWDEKYTKQIFMLDSSRDAIGITLKMLGYSLNTRNMDELEQAKEKLIEQKPLVLSYMGDDIKDAMIGGQAALAVVWSGMLSL